MKLCAYIDIFYLPANQLTQTWYHVQYDQRGNYCAKHLHAADIGKDYLMISQILAELHLEDPSLRMSISCIQRIGTYIAFL